MQPQNPWRVPAPELKLGKHHSVIIDRGELKKAVAATNGNYLFSETGAGVQSLVIVGTPVQITEFLLNHQRHAVESQIAKLPKIYMGISPFKPKTRFTGVFPVNEMLVKVAGFLCTLLPTPNWATLIGIPGQLIDLKKTIDGISHQDKTKGDILYLKFSYLPEDGMVEVANKKLTFKEALHFFQKHYKKP
jgi:hypothetical protein